jgi:hypothetical protein
MSTPAQKRSQQMRSLLGSVGAAYSHAYTAIKVLRKEREADPSMKTQLNELMRNDLASLCQHLSKTERLLKILNDHYRNYPKPTPTAWEKMVAKEKQEEQEQKQNATRG